MTTTNAQHKHKAKAMTEQTIRAIVGPHCHIERGNATGEWVVDATACWTISDVERVRDIRAARGK